MHKSKRAPVPFFFVLIVLPPSETKAPGGANTPLDLAELTLPELAPQRRAVIEAVAGLAADPAASAAALGLGPSQHELIADNAVLTTGPTAPAIERYTGVLYDAFDYRSLTPAGRRKTADRVLIGSALFGAVGAADLIPRYRLSAGSSLPGFGTLAAHWKPHLTSALQHHAGNRLVIDLRSGGYAALGPIPGAITLTVVTEKPDGSRSVVSHFNKHTKGLAARTLIAARRTATTIDAAAAILAAAGHRVEVSSPTALTIITA